MSAKDEGIYSESTGQLVIHFQNPPASLKENLAASLLLDNNDHILTAVAWYNFIFGSPSGIK